MRHVIGTRVVLSIQSNEGQDRIMSTHTMIDDYEPIISDDEKLIIGAGSGG